MLQHNSKLLLAIAMFGVLLPGCFSGSSLEEMKEAVRKEQAAKQAEKPDIAAAPVVQAQPAPAGKRPNLLKRKTQTVVNKPVAMAENPALFEVENKINASDPLTAALQGYIAASSRVNVLNFQHQINLMKAAEDRNPTYQEIIDLIQQHNMEFNALPDYQMYAYDEKAGIFTILEDPAAKQAFQKKAQ